VTRFRAMFFRVDGLDEEDLDSRHDLAADTLEEAEQEALRLRRPSAANFLKILDDGLVVKRLSLGL